MEYRRLYENATCLEKVTFVPGRLVLWDDGGLNGAVDTALRSLRTVGGALTVYGAPGARRAALITAATTALRFARPSQV